MIGERRMVSGQNRQWSTDPWHVTVVHGPLPDQLTQLLCPLCCTTPALAVTLRPVERSDSHRQCGGEV